jgi:hypothetical protein
MQPTYRDFSLRSGAGRRSKAASVGGLFTVRLSMPCRLLARFGYADCIRILKGEKPADLPVPCSHRSNEPPLDACGE